MELKLVKIYRHGEDNAMVHMAIEAAYGFGGSMCRDIIQINYNGIKRETYISVKVVNPGAGAVVARMTEAITAVDFSSPKVAIPPLMILETLAGWLNLRYDEDEVERVLSGT